MFNFAEITPDLDFVNKFQSMAETLAEDNYQNMKNLNNYNQNLNQTFNQLKTIIKKLVNSYRELANRAILLQNQLTRKDPYNVLLLEKTKIDLSFGETAFKQSFFPLHALHSKKLDIISRKPENNFQMTSSKKSKTWFHKNIIREQFTLIQEFIQNNLKQSLVADPSKSRTIHKSIIMNLYYRWNESRGRIIPGDKDKAKLIKTKITEELKKLFTRMDHNEHKYRGIAFKQDIVISSTRTQDQVIAPDQIPELKIDPNECPEAQDFALSFDDVYDEQKE